MKTRLSVHDADYHHTAEGIPTWEWLLSEGWPQDQNVLSVEVIRGGTVVRVEVLEQPLRDLGDGRVASSWVDFPVSTPPPFFRS